MKTKLRTSLIFIFLICGLIQLNSSKSQTSEYKISADQYEWSNKMKSLGITTPERGLIWEISVLNEDDSNYLEITALEVEVTIKNTETQNTIFFDSFTWYVYLPPKESISFLIPTDLNCDPYNPTNCLGSYSVEVVDSTEYNSVPIEPYPYEFRIVSEEQFAKEVAQDQQGIFFNVPIYVEIGGVGIIGVIAAVVAWYYKKYLPKKEEEEVNQ